MTDLSRSGERCIADGGFSLLNLLLGGSIHVRRSSSSGKNRCVLLVTARFFVTRFVAKFCFRRARRAFRKILFSWSQCSCEFCFRGHNAVANRSEEHPIRTRTVSLHIPPQSRSTNLHTHPTPTHTVHPLANTAHPYSELAYASHPYTDISVRTCILQLHNKIQLQLQDDHGPPSTSVALPPVDALRSFLLALPSKGKVGRPWPSTGPTSAPASRPPADVVMPAKPFRRRCLMDGMDPSAPGYTCFIAILNLCRTF